MKILEFRFAFHARDFDHSVRFYRDVLEMSYLGGWDRRDGKGALLSGGGNAVVEIYGAAEGEAYTGPEPVAINLALRLEDRAAVDSCCARLIALGESVEGPPQDRHWGHRSFIVFDPDHIPVHIYCEIHSLETPPQ